MAWERSNRSERLPSNWKFIRKQVLDRDGFRCTWTKEIEGVVTRCRNEGTEVDHIRRGDDHSISNLRALCHEHHAAKTHGESMASRREIKNRFRRQPEVHPGLAYGGRPL